MAKSVLLAVWLIAAGIRVPQAQQVQPPTAAEIADRRAELQKLVDQYAAGDREIVGRALSKMDLLTRAALRDLLTDKAVPWSRARTAFSLEVSQLWDNSGTSWDFGNGLNYGRAMFDLRPTAIGTNAGDDRFELLYHQIALGMLEGRGAWYLHHAYLTAAASRLTKLEAAYPRVSNHIPLMRALDVAMQCCTDRLGGRDMGITVTYNSSQPAPSPAPTPEYATFLYEQAARNPALQQEALVRAAYIQERYNHANKGLELLKRATAPGDPIIDYATALIRAGLLDQKDLPAEAAESYQAALKIAPGAQVPAIGLAAALQRAGKIDAALEAAQRARRMSPDGFDPWPDFMRADARFVQSWTRLFLEFLK